MDRALADLRAGDTIVVWKLDRLGRSLRNLLEIAETLNERDVRTVAGIRAAQARGEHVGRPRALTASQIQEARKMLDRGENASHVARIMRVGRSTLYRAIITP